jgi:hypothetical protein
MVDSIAPPRDVHGVVASLAERLNCTFNHATILAARRLMRQPADANRGARAFATEMMDHESTKRKKSLPAASEGAQVVPLATGSG